MPSDKNTVQIKSGNFMHSCTREHDIRHVKSKWIAETYLERFRADSTWALQGIIAVVKVIMKLKFQD